MKTIYWAVKLDDDSRAALLTQFPAQHRNVYAEHMTIVFQPSEDVDKALMEECGTKVNLEIIGYGSDKRGQAVVVKSDNVSRIGGGIAHITLSCVGGTRPVYSNSLLKKHWDPISSSLILSGVIARFTRNGWDICKSEKSE
jgi:hypothetical protein